MWQHMIISMVLSFVKGTVKNPQHAAEFKEYLLELRDNISALYPGE